MQSSYGESFERDMGCTLAEWRMWLPQAIGTNASEISAQTARVHIGPGELLLSWQEAAPRRIGLMRIPRLQVSFQFKQLDDTERYRFMKRFDLYMQRGGG